MGETARKRERKRWKLNKIVKEKKSEKKIEIGNRVREKHT